MKHQMTVVWLFAVKCNQSNQSKQSSEENRRKNIAIKMQVKCSFQTDEVKFSWFTGKTYTCDVKETSGASKEKEIKSFKGTHELGKTDNDVEWVMFVNQPIGFVPANLRKVFPTMTRLTITDCGIENVSREDLKGLEGLEYLCLSKNKLTFLPDDLFADTKKLRQISFKDNRLERLSSNLLLPIEQNLQWANFKGNMIIDVFFNVRKEGKNDLAILKRTIDACCFPPESQADRMLKELHSAYGKISDCTIEVHRKTFKIHKEVLAAQSSVFKNIFNGEGGEVQIKNFGEDTFEKFLDFFYTARVDETASILEMFELASDLDVPELKKICKTRILAKLDESNAVEVFNIAHRQASIVLKRKSFEVIKKTIPSLDATFENKLDKVNRLAALKIEMDSIFEEK